MAWLSDEEYTFRQDIKEKKAAGRGAFHKKCGSKSKKCTLPSDYLSKKEREKMNGEVMSYNPNAWYTWKEFKKLPMEYQIKYINSLLTRYNCSFSAIAKYVFQMSDVGLRGHFTRQNQLQYINMPGKSTSNALHAGSKKLREDVEKALWPNHDEEIQNDSKSGSFEIDLVGGGSSFQEKIKQAQDAVNLYESRGMQMTPELINQIYEEKTGMSFALAMEHIEEPAKVIETVKESDAVTYNYPDPVVVESKPEDSTDVSEFSIIMGNLDMSIIEYVRNLFEGKKYVVNLEVKEVKEVL